MVTLAFEIIGYLGTKFGDEPREGVAVNHNDMKLVSLIPIAVLACTGCETTSTLSDSGLRAVSPMLFVEFDQIPPNERCVVQVTMLAMMNGEVANDSDVAACELAGFTGQLNYEIALSDADLLGQFETWHERISQIQNRSNIQIPTLDGYQLTLRYVSTLAVAAGGANIEIRVASNNHELYIDTDLPGIERYRDSEDGRVRLTFGNVFQISLPFSFIRENSGIFYRSRLNFAERFYFYDLDTQESMELAEADYRERL